MQMARNSQRPSNHGGPSSSRWERWEQVWERGGSVQFHGALVASWLPRERTQVVVGLEILQRAPPLCTFLYFETRSGNHSSCFLKLTVAGAVVRVCAMAACRRSARLAPLVKQEVVTPKKALHSKTVKVEPEAAQLEKITGSFKVVKKEDTHVDVKPLLVDMPSRRGRKKPKIEAEDDTKKPIVFVRREKTHSLPKAKIETANAATLVKVKDERVEEGNEFVSLAAAGPLLNATLEVAVAASGSPYPDFARPYPEECREVRNRLAELHGFGEYARGKQCPSIDPPQVLALEYRSEENALELSEIKEPESELVSSSPSTRRTVLDSLVGTILSQNTTDNNSKRAFASLKRAFPTWDEVHAADPKKVEDAIRCGGLAETKAKRIVSILDTILQERGSICLEYVRSMTVDEIKAELSRFKGVGPKTVACVLMFHLEQHEFPVDTHVFRLSKMLGWVPGNADREKTYLHMNSRVPDDVKYDLHCLLVTHGKRCPRCAKGGRAQTAPDGPCPLINWSPQMAISGH